MTRLPPAPWASLALLCLLAACGGGPRGDWREAVGRPTPNEARVTPRPPLAIPQRLDLPPPAAAPAAP